jgi:hypothetical protein
MAQTFTVARVEQSADVLLAVWRKVAVGRIEQRDRGPQIRERRKRLTPSRRAHEQKVWRRS